MNTLRALVLLALGLGSVATALAQTCVNAVPITLVGTYSGNSCGHPRFPALANGAIAVPSDESVYAVSSLSSIQESFQLSADPSLALSLFVCRNPCSTYTSCVAVGDVDASGNSPVLSINNPTDYFVVVGSTSGNCGGYSLTVSATLNH